MSSHNNCSDKSNFSHFQIAFEPQNQCCVNGDPPLAPHHHTIIFKPAQRLQDYVCSCTVLYSVSLWELQPPYRTLLIWKMAGRDLKYSTLDHDQERSRTYTFYIQALSSHLNLHNATQYSSPW